jgi:hypothetical protein
MWPSRFENSVLEEITVMVLCCHRNRVIGLGNVVGNARVRTNKD